jgi:hypothetical protein
MAFIGNKVNKLTKDDVNIIMNVFSDIETIKCIGEKQYQIHLDTPSYSSTLAIMIENKIISSISLLNSYDKT